MTTLVVLTKKSTISCGPLPDHGGTVSVQSSAKLQVNGQPVLLEASINNQSISGCQIKPKQPPSPDSKDQLCQTVSKIDDGKAQKLKVNNNPVILENLAGETNGTLHGVTPQKLLSGQANQNKLKAT
jgi:hypothetical protein